MPTRDHVGLALAMLARMPAPNANVRVAVAGMVPMVLRDAARLREQVRDDPGAPRQESAYCVALGELSDLATALSDREDSADYLAVCAEIRALTAASRDASAVWNLTRQPLLRARRPPKRPRAPPPGDDAEYYARPI